MIVEDVQEMERASFTNTINADSQTEDFTNNSQLATLSGMKEQLDVSQVWLITNTHSWHLQHVVTLAANPNCKPKPYTVITYWWTSVILLNVHTPIIWVLKKKKAICYGV